MTNKTKLVVEGWARALLIINPRVTTKEDRDKVVDEAQTAIKKHYLELLPEKWKGRTDVEVQNAHNQAIEDMRKAIQDE